MNNEMKYCPHCGTKLVMKPLENEGDVPFCPSCHAYKFQRFNVAVSMIVLNRTKDKILLIKQYEKDAYILVAGYVNPGEEAEAAVVREVKEETGLNVISYVFNHSHFYEASATLMLNFSAVVDTMELHPNDEIDSYKWFTIPEAKSNIYHYSLAERFLQEYLKSGYCVTEDE